MGIFPSLSALKKIMNILGRGLLFHECRDLSMLMSNPSVIGVLGF
jgi:hypothetical protein